MNTKRLQHALEEQEIETPAFVFDEDRLVRDAELARESVAGDHTQLLFAMKSFAVERGLRLIATVVDGLHASSLFEARLAREILGERGIIHLTSPGIRADDAEELFRLCDHVSFNSIRQWERFRHQAAGVTSCGLRVNPRLSNIRDERYDPCGRHSKLGASIEEVREVQRTQPERLDGLEGLLFHTNCDAEDTTPIGETVSYLHEAIPRLLGRLRWIDLGGGYLFHHEHSDPGLGERLRHPRRCQGHARSFRRCADLAGLQGALALIREHYHTEVFVEPGASISRRAGAFVTRVVDLFESSGRSVAVLDTTVNHMPEVLEFQFSPDVLGQVERGGHRYILAGATCLAGDVFGEYSLGHPLVVGSPVVILDMGAYSMVKAHMFNGVNLPAIYALDLHGMLELQRRFTYDDFLARCGGGTHVHT